MGAQIQKSHLVDLTEYVPALQQYRLRHCGTNYYVWDHSLQDNSLIEFPINVVSPEALKEQVEMFLFRHRHHLLVSTLFIRRNQGSGKGSVFYERVFTNLGRIKDIPFGDSLQFYYVGFKGFELLFKKFGYFEVEEEMFHITESKRVKIWLDKDISKSKPKLKQTKKEKTKGSEEEMVNRIIKIIQENSEPSITAFPIGQKLLGNATSFASAIQKLRQVCFQQKFTIPQKLTCLDVISKGGIGTLLDQYGEAAENRIGKQVAELKKKNNIEKALDIFAMRNENFTDNTESAAETEIKFQPVESIQTPIRPTQTQKRPKGITISHSLEKLQHQQRNCKNNLILNRQDHKLRLVQSPIKQLEERTQNFPRRYDIPTLSPQFVLHRPASHMPEHFSSNIAAHQRYFMGNAPAPQIRTNYVPMNPLIRRNSQENFRSQSPGNAYRVVVNTVNRPTSSVHFTSHINNGPRVPVNNFLNPVPLIRQPRLSDGKNGPVVPSSFGNCIEKPFNQKPEHQKQKKCEENSVKPQELKHRETFISNLSDFNLPEEPHAFRDQTNFKERFQNFKKSFNFDKKSSSKENQPSRPEITKMTSYKSCNQPLPEHRKHFFGGILQNQTITSQFDSNGFAEKRSLAQKKSEKTIKNDLDDFPSITDVSDNISSLPWKQKPAAEKEWREESVVVRHDPNVSKIQLPNAKKYEPQIDSEIWADMMKARAKQKPTPIESSS